MDFLDGILDEGSESAFMEGGDTGGYMFSTTAAAASAPAYAYASADATNTASPGMISANPWATSNEGLESSRAAAYGIAFEERDPVNLSQLNPAASVFGSSVQEQGEDKRVRSFYSDLLNE